MIVDRLTTTMPRKSPAAVAARRKHIVDLLAEGPRTRMSLEAATGVSKRCIESDLDFLRTSFDGQLVRESAGPDAGDGRVAYRWQGDPPRFLSNPLDWVGADECHALVAARGLLCTRRRSSTGAQGTGGLGDAIHRLLGRLDLVKQAELIERDWVTVSRFGVAQVDESVVIACLTAAMQDVELAFVYANLEGDIRLRRVAPQRLSLIRGEWYCIAWEDGLKVFRLSRMSDVAVGTAALPGKPHIPTHVVSDLLADSFYATGGSTREQVVMAVSPGAWRFISGRRWGTHQQVDEAPADLPTGWRRLRFSTTGVAEVRFWILGMGTGVRAEAPDHLVAWLRQESQDLAALYQRQPS